MGNNSQYSKFNKYIDFSIKLEKICYFPGESINGAIYLMGKSGLLETQLKNPKALFTIYEKQKYTYSGSDNNTSTESKENKYENYILFNNFIGANLLTGINIPFSYKIPILTHPTCSFKVSYYQGFIKHYFSIELPNLKVKRTLIIVIKNNANFTKENKLFKMPCVYFAKKSKSQFFINKGYFSITINLPKNVFYYDEPISYIIILDCKKIELLINKIDVSLLRRNRRNHRSDFEKARYKEDDLLLTKSKKLNSNLKEQVIQDVFNFPMNYKKEKIIFPPLIYESIEKNKSQFPKISSNDPEYKMIKLEKEYIICPSCRSGLVSIEYFLQIKLYFPSMTFDEKYEVPIDFLPRPDIKNIYNNIGNNNIFDSNENPNSFNNYKQIDIQYSKPKEIKSDQNKYNENIITLENQNNSNDQLQKQDLNINESGIAAPPPI